MISFKCNKCGKQFKVRVELAGRRVKCNACETTIQIPDQGAALPPAIPEHYETPNERFGHEKTPLDLRQDATQKSNSDRSWLDTTSKRIIAVLCFIFFVMPLLGIGIGLLGLLLIPHLQQQSETRAKAESYGVQVKQPSELRADPKSNLIEPQQERLVASAGVLEQLKNSKGIGISLRRFRAHPYGKMTFEEYLNNSAQLLGVKIQIDREENKVVRWKCGDAFEVVATGDEHNITGVFATYSKRNAKRAVVQKYPEEDLPFWLKDHGSTVYFNVLFATNSLTVLGNPDSASNLAKLRQMGDDLGNRSFTIEHSDIVFQNRSTKDGFMFSATAEKIDTDLSVVFTIERE